MRVTIDSLAFGGDGVGRAEDGRVVFVPGVAPGDEVEVAVEEEKKGFIRASVERVVKASAARVEPPCPIYAANDCGGCQWMHVSAAAQRAAKEGIVRRALRHVLPAEQIRPIETPSPELGWRRRTRLRWRRVGGGVLLGYAARRSHRLVDVPTCPQLEPRLDVALAAVREVLLPALAGGAGEIELLLGESGDVHVAVDGAGARHAAGAARALLGRAGVRGVILRDRDGADVIGEPHIELEPRFRTSAEAFAQVSAPGNATLRRLVMEGAGDIAGASVLELYGGSGNFTRDLVAAGARVAAVEEAPSLMDLNVGGVSFTPEPAERALARFVARGLRFDVIVLDPPRIGCTPEVLEAIGKLAPGRLVYVSCDPNTLARDLRVLAEQYGVSPTHAIPVDLMPQTFHIEVVAWAVSRA